MSRGGSCPLMGPVPVAGVFSPSASQVAPSLHLGDSTVPSLQGHVLVPPPGKAPLIASAAAIFSYSEHQDILLAPSLTFTHR